MSEKLEIFGNKSLLELIASMKSSGRVPHAIVLFGPEGVGKKTIAKYLAAQFLCYDKQKSNTAPCMECKSCRMLMHDNHPDIIWVKPSGKGNYKIDDFRPICTDAYIPPNESERKIYIIPDFEKAKKDIQHVLLKVIEEPPASSSFIFTAKNKECFLETIISRVISLGVTEVSKDECKEALIAKGISVESVNDAVYRFNGNIGKCLEYINDKDLRSIIDMTQATAQAIAKKDEYAFISSFSTTDRNEAKAIITLLIDIMRDACAYRLGSDVAISCCKDVAKQISTIANVHKCNAIIDELNTAALRLDSYGGANIVISALGAKIKTIIS